jgi:hypothetical protein
VQHFFLGEEVGSNCGCLGEVLTEKAVRGVCHQACQLSGDEICGIEVERIWRDALHVEEPANNAGGVVPEQEDTLLGCALAFTFD